MHSFLASILYICWRKAPTAKPIGVPTVYPREPVRRAGVICEVQPLLDAIAAAVPGPPMAAFEAVSRACKHGHSPVSCDCPCHTRPKMQI